jgi:hypothetical protein
MDDAAESTRLDQSIDIGSDDNETAGLVGTPTAPGGKKAAATSALPPGLTVAHFMCEFIYFCFMIYLVNIAGFIDRWLGNFGEEYGVQSAATDKWDAFTVGLYVYFVFHGVAVVGAMVASCSCCRKVCGGYRGDRCGTVAYLVTNILSSCLSLVEVVLMVYTHLHISKKQCYNLYRDNTAEATKWHLVQHLISMFSAMVLIKLVMRLGAMAGALQRLCCANIADSLPSGAECLQSSRAHKKNAGCFACGEINPVAPRCPAIAVAL